MKPLKWSKKKPTKPGQYIWFCDRLEKSGGEKLALVKFPLAEPCPNCRFIGPIPEPEKGE